MAIDPHSVSYDDTDPERTIRTDLWPSMTVQQLSRQQELVIDKMSTLSKIMGGATPTIHHMYSALEVALQDISNLVEHRSAKKPRKLS